MPKLSAKLYFDDRPNCLDYRFPWKRNKRKNTHLLKGKTANGAVGDSNDRNSLNTRLSRENLLKSYLSLIKRKEYNYFGTVTSQWSKSETYFRQLLLGNKYIKKHNHTDLPEHILDKILWTQRFSKKLKRHGLARLEAPNFINLTLRYQKEIEFYQDGNYIEDGIKANILDPYEQNYIIDHSLQKAGVQNFFGVLEYGSKNGYCHMHFLLKHSDTQNVYPKYWKDTKTGKVSRRLITTKDNPLQMFFRDMQKIGYTDLQLIENKEASIKYVSKYLLKQYQGFGIDRPEPLGEHSQVCTPYYHNEGYCEQIYKGSYINGKQKEIDTPVNRFIDFDIQEKQFNLI